MQDATPRAPLRSWIPIGFGMVLAVSTASAVVSFFAAERLIANDARVAHSREVLAALEALQLSVTDAETGQRGYLLTTPGHDEFRQPYDEAARTIREQFDHLRELTAEDPGQQPRLEALRRAADAKLDELHALVGLQRDRGPGAALARVLTGEGRRRMDAVRAAVADMEDRERQLLADRARESAASASATRWLIPLGAIVSVQVLGLAYALIRRESAVRRAAAERVRREREWFETTLLGIGDGVIATDDKGRVRLLNPVAEALTGWKTGEAAGLPVTEVFRIVNERTRQPVASPVERCLAEGAVVGLANHTVLIAKDGAERPIDDSGAPIRSGAAVVGAVLVFRDITERRQAEREAEKAREVFRLAHQVGRIGHWEWNPATGGEEWPPETEALYGLAPGAFPGGHRDWVELLHPDDRDRAERDVQRALETGRYVAEFRVVRPDGTVRWLEARAEVFKDGSGKPVRVVGVDMDVTDRKRAEEALREANRRKDDFLALLGHELRNPLAPVRTALSVVREGAAADPYVARFGPVIERQLAHLVRLVDDLLDVSRINRGKVELRKRAVNLTALAALAAESSRPGLDARRHHFELDLPRCAVWVEADPDRVEQVVCNLLNNAGRYTPPGGRVRLSLGREGDEAVLRVRDSGIGIRPESLSTIWEMFRQAERVEGTAPEGLGLGLTLVRRLVELHGGRVEAASDGPGQGSVFTVRLPALPVGACPPERAPQPTAPGPSESLSVLVVDDNKDAADTLALVLQLAGHRTRTAGDGPQALAAAREFRPEAALVDIGLPGDLDGYEVARRLRQEPGMEGMLLVAVTGYGTAEDMARAREAGFDGHITKPADTNSVRRLLAERRAGGG